MLAFTLRLDDSLAKMVDKKCRREGYSKTGLVKRLLKQWLEDDGKTQEKSNNQILLEKYGGVSKRPLSDFIGCISLGGNSVEDCDNIFDEEF